MIVVSTVVKDNGALNQLIHKAKLMTAKVEVGYFGNAKHANKGGKRPITLGNLARIHEFGTKRTPKRPFLAPALKKNRGRYLKLAHSQFLPLLRGQSTATAMWELIGQKAVADVQDYMVTANFTPLSKKTIKYKGSSKPLIDTGQLHQSVTYRVKK